MSPAEKNKTKVAEEFQMELEAREEARLEAERRGLKSLNQGMDATGHDAKHSGINWGPSYRSRRKAKAKQGSKNNKK